MTRPKSNKRDRERARAERAAAKVARRHERLQSAPSEDEQAPTADQSVVLAELAELHRRFDANEIEFDEFDAAKRELTDRLDVR